MKGVKARIKNRTLLRRGKQLDSILMMLVNHIISMSKVTGTYYGSELNNDDGLL